MSSVWDWVHAYHDHAHQRGDEERIRLCHLYFDAPRPPETEPDRALALFAEGRALARRMDEPWWEMFFAHWRLQVLLYNKGEYARALDEAALAALEARKPEYAGLPQRVCLHEDLILAYVGTDPAGHAELIERSLAYMRGEISPRIECSYCLEMLIAEFELGRGRLDAAEAAAARLLNWDAPDGAAYYPMQGYRRLCQVAERRGDRERLGAYAAEGEVAARREALQVEATEFIAWRALAARSAGDADAAARQYHRAVSSARRLTSPPTPSYFEALSAYHELAGEWEQALEVCDRHLAVLAEKGRTAVECDCRVSRCRVLRELGRPLEAAVAEAREVAGRLADPAPVLAELDGLVAPRR